MRILAVDPTLRKTACVLFDNGKLVDAWFVSTTSDREKWETAAEKDQRDVVDWVNKMNAVITESRPDVVCAEQSLGGGKDACALKQLSLIAGAMYTMSTLSKTPVWLFTRVHSAKRAAVGKAKATKEEIITAMVARFPELGAFVKGKAKGGWNGRAEHYADACANYLACIELPVIKMKESLG